MAKKILIVGNADEGKSALMLQTMKEKYGEDVVLYTTEEAREQGLKPEDFSNLPTFEIKAPPMMEEPITYSIPNSGQENRRLRRKQKRNKK